MKTYSNYIAGELKDSITGKTRDIINPATTRSSWKIASIQFERFG